MTWLVIDSDSTLSEREDAITLDALQKAVDGYIELAARPQPNIIVYCNEEGRLRDMRPNVLASRLAGHLIVGPVAIVGARGPQEVQLAAKDLNFLRNVLRLLTSSG